VTPETIFSIELIQTLARFESRYAASNRTKIILMNDIAGRSTVLSVAHIKIYETNPRCLRLTGEEKQNTLDMFESRLVEIARRLVSLQQLTALTPRTGFPPFYRKAKPEGANQIKMLHRHAESL